MEISPSLSPQIWKTNQIRVPGRLHDSQNLEDLGWQTGRVVQPHAQELHSVEEGGKSGKEDLLLLYKVAPRE